MTPEATRPSAGQARRPSTLPKRVAAPSGSLYRMIWRWHFYAGILVAPTLLVVTITGALYIFRSEIENLAHADLRFVAPAGERAGAQAQVDAAVEAFPGRPPASIELPADPGRSSVVRLGEGRGALAVHVDPFRARPLGAIDPDRPGWTEAFFTTVLKIHRELLAGWPGRLVVELTVGWTILLLATGLYLWWPRRGGGPAGVWWARFRAKPYTVLRDLHTVLGFYLLAPVAVIAVSGLFYCLVWGEAFHRATRGRPEASGGGTPSTSAAVRGDPDPTPMPALSLDRIEALARARYPDRNLFITLPEPGSRTFSLSAGNDYDNSYGPFVSARFELDRRDGRMVSHSTLAEDERYWWHGWAYPLHVGSVLGPTTKVIWLVACLVLAAMPVTGLWMWWIRRPAGRAGFPRRPDRPVPRGLVAAIAALSLLLPVVGASILLILTGEAIVGVVRRALARQSPAPA
ncbi:PepSY-associated TM helix [Tautonia plasticadhaerens]|uniref:PepSY-associated TM helix n=2 Tax=Tautonia plasticadhaerens TaxID=2527974 RepID=A0A518GWU0_9BACT|nr:PepSY-associated TM helix [Tautonia plasticadhaerens]